MLPSSDPLCLPLRLPYPQIPEYECGEYGKWSLELKADETFERGYFSGWNAEPPGHYIVKEGHVWMSTSRLERESHAVHLHDAEGTVVMCGIGMGMYLFNIAAKPAVKKIIAVDLDTSVMDLVRNATGFDSWAGRDKLVFVHKNAMELTPADLGNVPIDYLYVDIWPELGNPEALPQTRAIQAGVKARKVGWWGQELDFIQWIFENRPAGHVPLPVDLLQFNQATGLPLAEQSAGYLLGCIHAGEVYSSYGSLPFAVALRDGK
jgi:hypothetical protein